MPKEIKLRSSVTRGASSVDLEKHIIKGYSVISIGELLGHDVEADEKTLDQVVEHGNSHKQGTKSRFGHPNMSNTAFGTYLGRTKNYYKDGERVRADLHISETAFNSPKGDLGGYVEEMALKEPDMFGASIVVKAEYEYRINEDGTRQKDKAGNELMPLLRVQELMASDVVDEPATGDPMFEFFSDGVKPSAEVTAFLDEYFKQPDAMEKATSFFNRYIENGEYKQSLLESVEKVAKMGKENKELENKETENKKTKLKITLDEEHTMPDEIKKETPEDKQLKAREKEIAELAKAQERERIDEITVSCETFGLTTEFAKKLITDNVSLSDARKSIMDEYKTGLESVNKVKVTSDNTDLQREAMVNSMLLNSGSRIVDAAGKNVTETVRNDVAKTQYNGLSLQTLARVCLEKDGVSGIMFMNGEQLFHKISEMRYFAQAPTQGSGDFVNVLSNVLNKSVQMGWQTAPATYPTWVKNGSLKDFKQADLPRLSEIGDLKEIGEGAAPEMQKMADLKELARLSTWGGKYILSRVAMVNDDLAQLTTIPAKFARALQRLMNKRAYGLLFNNNGATSDFAGPTMNQDSVACFHATSHNANLVAEASGAAPSQATLDTGFLVMRGQTAQSPDNSDSATIRLDISPKYILHGPKYDLQVFKLLNNFGYNVDGEDSDAHGTQAVNIHGPGQPRSLVSVSDSEIGALDGTYSPWYLAADPMDCDTVTLWTLNGKTSPFTDAAPTPVGDARGMIWTIEHDYVFSVVDYRGLYCNSGATL